MPVTFPIPLPDVSGFVDFSWLPESAVAVQENEFTYALKIFPWDGALRRATMTVGSLNLVQAKEWEAFYLRLNGAEGSFWLQDPIGADHRGAYDFASGSLPKVNGSEQMGRDLVTDGWPAGVTGLLLKGDYISIRNRLYQLTSDANSDGSGNATLEIWPHATFRLQDNDDISVGIEAFGEFCLESNSEFPRNIEHRMEGFKLTVREKFLMGTIT